MKIFGNESTVFIRLELKKFDKKFLEIKRKRLIVINYRTNLCFYISTNTQISAANQKETISSWEKEKIDILIATLNLFKY